jgi:OOP family OmpA-OmpF porin
MNDTDKDGVPDYLDSENNTITGVAVDTKGRAVDFNNNGVPDELESYIDNKYNSTNNTIIDGGDINSYTNSQMKTMINGGYVNVFFDFDKSNLTPGTLSAVNFLIKYLKTNTSSKCDVIGYADALGDSNYNLALAKTRATNVREIIIKSGISADRINLIVNGVDNSIPKDSKLARQLARRVGFKVD